VTAPEFDFVHRFVAGQRPGAMPLLLLHGTGGNEDDLLSLGQALAPGSPLLSPRGQVLEDGMPRFFRRYAEGIFDVEDIKFRAGQLARFISQARTHYQLGDVPPIAARSSGGSGP